MVLRNYFLYQSIFPKSNGLMLWLNEYDDVFVYPSLVITFSRWIETGLQTIILDRLIAFINNMQTLLASGGAIILMPLIVIGYWKNRKENIVRISAIMLLVILGVMSVAFPYAGERGGFFHSLSSIQILLWSLVPSGLNEVIQWVVDAEIGKSIVPGICSVSQFC